MIITVGGLIGSGKTTLAKSLAEELGFKYLSIGSIMRDMAKERGMSIVDFNKLAEDNPEIDDEIDKRQKLLAKGDCVVDSRLGAFLLKPDLRIWLTAPFEDRAKRVLAREKTSFEEAAEGIKRREESEKNRYQKVYGVNLDDMKVYDLIINTKTFDKGAMMSVSLAAAKPLSS